MEKKTPLSVRIFGCSAVVLLSLYSIFKILHWPGANIMAVAGHGLLLLFYLPLWLINEPKKGRYLIVCYQFLVIFLSVITSLFKSLYWPGGGTIFNIWLVTMLFVVFPVSLVQLIRLGRKSLMQFHNGIVLFYLGILVVSNIGGAASRMHYLAKSFSRNNDQVKNSTHKLIVKNKQLYAAFDGLNEKEKNIQYKKANELKFLCDSTYNYVRKLRNHLVAVNEMVSEEAADSLEVSDLRDLNNTKVATSELCGTDFYTLREGKYSGKELQKVIESFRDSVVTFVEGENRNFIKSGINLSTDPGVDEGGDPLSWVIATFYNIPVSAAILTLESMEYEIKNAETQVLTDLLNNASKNSENNLASKIADLGFKLEDEKKQREIGNLQKERELSQLRLNSKNSEIDEANRVIVYFFLGLLICSVLLFFIVRSNLIRKKINAELKTQKQEIEHKNKEITDSINYAKRIQQAILPPVEIVYNTLKDSFILYKPKDVVSGDFYGFIHREDYVIVIAADCTGHGVPGAFMSMIGNDQLNNIITEKKITQPAKILDELHRGIRMALKQDQAHGQTRDGMDIALCKLNLKNNQLEYAGAMRPLWVVREGKLLETKADKQPIGGLDTESRKPFTNHIIDLQKNDCIYIFTDGYADQFGGEKGKKFMVKNFEKMLLEINNLPMAQQSKVISEKFEAWKANNEQVDDVLVIGIGI